MLTDHDPRPPFPLPRHHLGGYQEYAPPRSLGSVSEAIWWHRTPVEGDLPVDAAHRVLPDPSLSLAFMCRRDDTGHPHDARVLIIGPVVVARPYPLRPGQELAAVKLKLEWSEPVLGIAPREQADALTDLDVLDARLAPRLLDALLATRSAPEAVAVLVEAVAARAGRASAHNAIAPHALDVIRRTGGRPDVARLAQHLATSARHLRRTVRQAAGVSLKAYGRTRRFLRAVMIADRRPPPGWARLAAETGYYDQSHLVREFRTFAGLSPQRLLRERRAESVLSNP